MIVRAVKMSLSLQIEEDKNKRGGHMMEKKLIEMKRDAYLGRATIFTSFNGGSA